MRFAAMLSLRVWRNRFLNWRADRLERKAKQARRRFNRAVLASVNAHRNAHRAERASQ